MPGLGRSLILFGIVVIVLGIAVTFAGRLPIRFGRLPGDIVWRGRNSTVYFPVVTCILLSLILTVAMWIFRRFF